MKVAIDTSGSIDESTLSDFMSEVAAVLRAYPHVQGACYFADVEAYGPYPLDQDLIGRRPEGRGGTSFAPFFDAVGEGHDPADLLVYFTDGFGSFPPEPPEAPVLWVVTPDGRDNASFPFGDVARMGLGRN